MPLTMLELRRHALARSLGTLTSLPKALAKLGFVQADPLRAPGRAQDLILFQRVKDYREGELSARYPQLGVEEEHFVNYGFVTHALQALMHPRRPRLVWTEARWAEARAVQAFVRGRGVVHPREVDAAFAGGTVKNWFGGASRASTQLLDGMHYRGLLRVHHREGSTRCYEAVERDRAAPTVQDAAALDALLDAAVAVYAPLPASTLAALASALVRHAAPQWWSERARALQRAKARLAHGAVEGELWYWPAAERPSTSRRQAAERVRLLAPFDPVVWDRTRFERFWGWAYRFEAYTPAPKRKLGHYALPLLWREEVIGWANLSRHGERLVPEFGFVAGAPPGEAAFRAALDDELARLARCLGAR